MNYKKFREMICVNNKSFCTIGAYNIEVLIDAEAEQSYWDKCWFLANGKYRIYMTDISRSTHELLFDFYREVGRISLYHKLIDNFKADKYYDKHKVISPTDRLSLVEEMTVDEFAVVQMNFCKKPNTLLPFMVMKTIKEKLPSESEEKIKKLLEIHNECVMIRRQYLEYIFKHSKTTTKKPKKLKNDNVAEESSRLYTREEANEIRATLLDMGESLMGYTVRTDDDDLGKKEPMENKPKRKPIQNISLRLNLHDWSTNFDDNMKAMIKAYTPELENVDDTYFKIETKKYIVLHEEPEDWSKGGKYYRRNPDFSYSCIKKSVDFIEDTYYLLEEKDINEIIKGLHKTYHSFMKTYIVPLYNTYKRLFSVNERDMYQYIIERILSNFIDTKKMPQNDAINELKALYLDMNKGHMISSLSKETKEKMLSYKERKKILDTLITRVVEKYGITNYEIRDEYGLNSVMNKVIELNDAKNMKTIEETLLPFIVQV